MKTMFQYTSKLIMNIKYMTQILKYALMPYTTMQFKGRIDLMTSSDNWLLFH